MKIKKIAILIVSIAMLLSLAACGQTRAVEDVQNDAPAGIAVQAMRVTVQDLSRENVVSGRTVSSAESSVYVPGAVKVTKVYVKEGQSVSKGDRLFSLDMNTLAIPAASLEQIRLLNLQLGMAQDAWDAAKALYDIGASSRVEVESAQLQYLSVKLQRDSAVATLGAGMSYSGMTVEFADAAGTVVASESGKITVLNAKAGEYASAEHPIVTIQGSEHSYISVSVSESLKPRLSIGDPVQVSIGSLGITFEGTIRTIDASASLQTKLYAVSIAVPDSVEGVSSGMFADVTFFTETSMSTVAVPSEAVLTGDDGEYVYIVKDGAARRTPVTTGMTSGGQTEILSGLSEGDTVVTVGQSYLRDGEAVRVVSGE